jgi:hypothetical protein
MLIRRLLSCLLAAASAEALPRSIESGGETYIRKENYISDARRKNDVVPSSFELYQRVVEQRWSRVEFIN